MSLKIKIEKKKEYLAAIFSGEATFKELGKRLGSIADRCRAEKKTRLLVDFSGIESAPSFSDRYRLEESAVIFAEYGIKVAVFGTSNLMDPEHLGELVARNRGANLSIFTERAAAEKWLTEK